MRQAGVPALTLVIGVVAGLGATVGGDREQNPPPWRGWTALALDARAIPFFTGRVEMRIERRGASRELTTRSVARFLGAKLVEERTRTIFDPATGRPRSHESVSKKRARRYSFGASGYRVEKLLPENGADAPLDEWKVSSSAEFDYPRDADGRSIPVFDSYGMILQLGRLDLDAVGDEAEIVVATSKGPVAYRILVAEERRGSTRLENPPGTRSREVPTHELRLRVMPADPERATESFLAMEGETELWVEAGTKTLTHLSGKVPKVPGRVRLTLVELG